MTGEEHLDIVYDRVQKNYEEALKREKDLEARLNNEIKEKNVLETYIKMVEDQLGVEIATQLDLEKKLKASDAKLAEKTQETTKLSSTLDKTTKERDSIRTEVGSLKAEKEKLNTELSREKKDRAAAVEEKNKLSAEMAKLKEELTAAKSENEKSKQAKDKALEEARKATEAKSAAETQLSADKKKLEGEVALLSQEKNKAVQDQSKYVQEVLKLTEEKNKLSAELTKSQSSTPNSNGKDNSNALKKQIESLTQELEQSKEIRKKLQDEVASLKKPATDSPKRSNSNGSSSGAEGPVVAALKKQLESEQKTSEALRKQLNDLTSKRRGSSQASTIERAALEAKLSVLEEELAAKKKLDIELTNAKKELETLKSQAPSNNNTNDKGKRRSTINVTSVLTLRCRS
jgi:chromosome segregation ATPase